MEMVLRWDKRSWEQPSISLLSGGWAQRVHHQFSILGNKTEFFLDIGVFQKCLKHFLLSCPRQKTSFLKADVYHAENKEPRKDMFLTLAHGYLNRLTMFLTSHWGEVGKCSASPYYFLKRIIGY